MIDNSEIEQKSSINIERYCYRPIIKFETTSNKFFSVTNCKIDLILNLQAISYLEMIWLYLVSYRAVFLND